MSQPFDEAPLAPHGRGILGHMGEFAKDRMAMLKLLAQTHEPFMRLRSPFPGVNVGVANTPETAEQVLVQQAKAFHKSDMSRLSLYPLAGEGLFSSNGELWKTQRKLMAPLFTPKSIGEYAEDMLDCTERAIADLEDGQVVQLHEVTTRLTMSVAGRSLFNADTFSEADEIGKALTTALEWSGNFLGAPFAVVQVMAMRRVAALKSVTPRRLEPFRDRAHTRLQTPLARLAPGGREMKRAVALLDEYVQKLIDERRSAEDAGSDLLARLLLTKNDDGQTMSDRQLRDEVLTLFIAGHETTATSLAWSIALLAKHPNVLAKVQAEVDALAGPPTLSDLPNLDLTLRVFKEALRIYPSVYVVGRDAIAPACIGGFDLGFRTNVFVSPYSIHRNPKEWPDPEVFDPDRFLPEPSAKRHRYAYLPFGAGPRVCIGNHFAYMEAQIALATLLRKFEFEVLSRDVPVLAATLRPSEGVRVRIRKR